MKKHIIGACILVLVAAGSILLFPPRPLMSDARLTSRFAPHAAALERIARMAKEDSQVTAVHRDFVLLKGGVWRDDSEEGFSSERWNAYRDAFRQTGDLDIDGISKVGGIMEFSPTSVAVEDIEDSMESLVISKGFAYSENPPMRLSRSLDEMGFESAETYYKAIGGNWYLYRDFGVSKPE